MVGNQDVMFGASFGCYLNGEPVEPVTPQCEEFIVRGVLPSQAVFALLHLNIWLNIARFSQGPPSRHAAIANVKDLAGKYSRLLTFSRQTWMERGPNHFPKCSWNAPTRCHYKPPIIGILSQGSTDYQYTVGAGDLNPASNQANRYMSSSVSEMTNCNPHFPGV